MLHLEPNQWRVLAVLVTDLAIAVFVLTKNPKRRINQYWFFVGLMLFITNLRDFIIPFTSTSYQAIYTVMFVEIGIFFLPTALWLFVNEIFEPVLGKDKRDAWTKLFFACSSIFYGISFIPAVNHYETIRVGAHFIAKPGITALFVFAFYQVAFIVGIFYAWKVYKRANNNLKHQVRIIIFAIAVFAIAEIDFLTVSQLSPRSFNYGYLAIMAGNVMIAYSILRYQVMDIVVILKKGLVYSIAMAVLAGAYVAFIRAGESLLLINQPNLSDSLFLTIPAIVLIAIAFEPLRAVVQRIVDDLFFKTRYDYQEAIKQFSRMVVTILNLDILLHQTVMTIKDTLKIRQAVIFVFDSDRQIFEVGAFAGADEKDIQNWRYGNYDKLVTRLRGSDERVHNIIDDFGSNVAVSLFINRELIGFVTLGEKLSGDTYSVTDFELLSTLSDQLSIAIENAKLYREAVTDKLTRLFSGNYFYDRLDEELQRSREQGSQLSVILFDVNDFMQFSKDRGAVVANQALELIGHIIIINCRVFDIAARVGDDEFAVIMPGIGREAAMFAAHAIQNDIKTARIDGQAGIMSISSGIAYTDRGAKSSRRLISDARFALLSNKDKAIMSAKQTNFTGTE